MAPLPPFHTYKETRLNLDSPTQNSAIAIRLPALGASTVSKASQKRHQVAEHSSAESEESFGRKHIATASSIYHRRYHSSPRSFLWRILENGTVLSIRAVDFSRDANASDATLCLRLSFPGPIRSGCVALADSENHDVLSAFVLLESNHLYTLSLRPEFFRKASSTEDNVGDWCKVVLPTVYATRSIPYKLAALSADEVVISNNDGVLARLLKNSGGDGLWSALDSLT